MVALFTVCAHIFLRVISRICICCGEPFFYGAGEASANPNICTACSRLADDAAQEQELHMAETIDDLDAVFDESIAPQNAS
jgi:hypothetical protein